MEVDRNPETPELSSDVIELITDLCFRKNDALKEVDGVFVFSSMVGIEELTRLIDGILTSEISNKLFITGGVTPQELLKDMNMESSSTEADILLKALDLRRYKDLEVFTERISANTLENVTETLKFPEFKSCKSLLFIFKSHAAGRGYLTLKKFFPDSEILQQTFDTKYQRAEKSITRDNWHTFEFGRTRVWGEFLRIKKYGGRGDIEYEEVRDLVRRIDEEVHK